MSQSKMTVTDNIERKFVIKHFFKDVMNMKEGETVDGPVQYHYNIPWKIRISRDSGHLMTYLDCMVSAENPDWSIDTEIIGRTIDRTGEKQYGNTAWIYHKEFPRFFFVCCVREDKYFFNCGDIVYDFTVIVKKLTGLDVTKKLKSVDDESAKEDSDVTLIVKDKRFHVCKMYLSHHSNYFKALFSGNFAESRKSEIELKDIDPNDFQNFVEFLYAESSIEAHSVLGILHLADFFDAKIVIRRCEEFLVQKSELQLKDKFHAATKYSLEKLKEKCISELKTNADFLSIVPDDPSQFDGSLWKELYVKSNSCGKLISNFS